MVRPQALKASSVGVFNSSSRCIVGPQLVLRTTGGICSCQMESVCKPVRHCLPTFYHLQIMGLVRIVPQQLPISIHVVGQMSQQIAALSEQVVRHMCDWDQARTHA